MVSSNFMTKLISKPIKIFAYFWLDAAYESKMIFCYDSFMVIIAKYNAGINYVCHNLNESSLM